MLNRTLWARLEDKAPDLVRVIETAMTRMVGATTPFALICVNEDGTTIVVANREDPSGRIRLLQDVGINGTAPPPEPKPLTMEVSVTVDGKPIPMAPT